MPKPDDDIPGWRDGYAPDEIVKKTQRDTLYFNRPGAACCLCWQAFAPGERIRIYTFPSGTEQWFHHGHCWRSWWIEHEPIIAAAAYIERSSEPPDNVVQVGFTLD